LTCPERMHTYLELIENKIKGVKDESRFTCKIAIKTVCACVYLF